MSTTLDDELLRDFFGTQEQRDIFDARARLQAWLDVERALVEVQAQLGVVPESAAERIAGLCDASTFDLERLGSEINAAQHPLVPVVHELERRAGDAARFVHYGATTQDIMDTAHVLQLRRSFDVVERDLRAAAAHAAQLAQTYSQTVQAGRTRGQHAVPITFGLKAATWLDELDRAVARIREARPRLLVAQIGGAAGTLAAYGEQALSIKAGVAQRLGLGDAAMPWHATRDRTAEVGSLGAMIAGVAERIASEIIRLQAPEFSELAEPLRAGHVGSSTMPQKRNPHLCEMIVAKARIARGLGSVLLGNAVHQHERDVGAWAVEWLTVPQLLIVVGAIAADTRTLLSGLHVAAGRMRANIEQTGGQILAEALMMRLDPFIGRARAHELLVELTRSADAEGRPFADVVRTNPRVTKHLSAEDIAAALDPEQHTGLAATLVAARLAAHRAQHLPPA
jgi:3-carboxy-cis,cis-muconate cycloisomerase